MLITEIMDGFNERMKNIAVFKPLFDLEQKRKFDYSLLELGIVVLLFILEKMLSNEDCTYHDLADFLEQIINQHYEEKIDYKRAQELSYYLVRDCLLNQGRPHKVEYQDYESKEQADYKFHLIQLKEYEIDDNIVKLELSPVGLELLFKTKEMYNELQVSISQLYLKQQIQKGVFDGALRSVKELRLAVKNEKERLRKLREKIIRDVLQVAREGLYKQELERINTQLEREQTAFQELMELVAESLETYYETYQQQEINKVMKLKNKLLETATLHESLLTTKLEIENLMNKSMENMILNTFSTTVNFETEILETVVNNDNSLDQLKNIVEPLFSSNLNSHFNLNRIFERQNLYNKVEKKEDQLWEVEEEKLRQKEKKERQAQQKKEKEYKKWLKMLLEPLLEQSEIKLSQIIADVKQNQPAYYGELTSNLDFYPFILKLHQLDTIPIVTEKELGGVVIEDLFWVLTDLVTEKKELQRLNSFELLALDDQIKLAAGYLLSDFVIRRGNNGA